jgi:peptidoglycan glycosyltransferase
MRRLRRQLIALTVVVLIALLAIASWLPVRHARELWRVRHDAETIEMAQAWSRLRLWPAQYHQLLAATYLDVHNRAAARPHLDALARGGRLWISALPKEEVARRLGYEEFLAYDAASHERDTNEVLLYRCAAQIATGHLDEAEATLNMVERQAPRLSDSEADRRGRLSLHEAIEQRKQGSYPLILDRNGQPIALYQIANHDLIAINRDFDSLIDARAGALTFGAQLPRLGVNDTIETTLDPAIQKAALQALGGFRGALVAIDPQTNEILAIASNRGRGDLANLALEQQYEPGSIVKVLTGLNALESGVDVRSMFPYDCKGDLLIDGRHFADWIGTGHGVLPSIDDALAESCNIAFADIGLRLGADRLHRFMSAAGFDQQANLGVLQVPLGRNVGQTVNRYETALYSIGLMHESVNALHVAMIGSMMANRGVMTTPRLLRARHSLLGEVTMQPPAQMKTTLGTPAHAEAIVQAMVAVTTSPKGTGRRAVVDGVPMAMKTGTAGERANGGLEALIVAFAPVDHPRIAFGISAEDAGPAEYAGAKIAHDFVAAWRLLPR